MTRIKLTDPCVRCSSNKRALTQRIQSKRMQTLTKFFPEIHCLLMIYWFTRQTGDGKCFGDFFPLLILKWHWLLSRPHWNVAHLDLEQWCYSVIFLNCSKLFVVCYCWRIVCIPSTPSFWRWFNQLFNQYVWTKATRMNASNAKGEIMKRMENSPWIDHQTVVT